MTDPRDIDRDLSTADVVEATERVERRVDARGLADEREIAVPRASEGSTVNDDADASSTPLLDESVTSLLRSRWTEIQTAFVDEPRRAVEQADALVAEAVKRLAESFAGTRSTLEHQWSRGDDVSTEDLRLVLRRYRAFFGRLLEV
jgi:hypothetical protein